MGIVIIQTTPRKKIRTDKSSLTFNFGLNEIYSGMRSVYRIWSGIVLAFVQDSRLVKWMKAWIDRLSISDNDERLDELAGTTKKKLG